MIEKQKNFISVVFNVENSSKYIKHFFDTVIREIDNNYMNYELICVENNLDNNTISLMKNYMHKCCNEGAVLNIIHLSSTISHEEALTYGIDLSIGDFVYLFNSLIVDYGLNFVMNAYYKLLEDNDIVSISPNKKITITQKIYYSIYNFGVSKNNRIFPERFSVISRRAINRASSLSVISALSMATFANCGLNTYRITFNPSKERISYNFKSASKRSNEVIENLIIHTNTFPRIVLLLLLFSLLCTGITLFVNIKYCMLWILISILLAVCLIIIKYISVIIRLNYKNKVQLIKSIEKDAK